MVEPFKIPVSSETEWVFPSAYGGACRSPNPPQIHELMRQLRIEVGSLAAKKQAGGPMFPVRGAKELNQKLADALNALDMTAPVVAQEITILDAKDVPDNKNAKGNVIFRTLCHVKATVRLTAPDTSFIDMVGSGHGGDVDDKSGGKASTYAWKDALLKGLTIPHEDMVDTDDASTTGEEGPGAKQVAAKGGRKAKDSVAAGSVAGREESAGGGATATGQNGLVSDVGGGDPASGNSADLAYVIGQIKGAESVEALENIRAKIKSGVLALELPEKMEASKVFTARMKEIKGE